MQKTIFGHTADGDVVELHTLTNRNGLIARLTTWGAGLVEMHVPDRSGVLADVTLGFDALEGYLTRHPYFGVTTGRFANRIAGGKFTLDGKIWQLATNDGANHLHGGLKGFDQRNWAAAQTDAQAVRFTYMSPHGEEGYPGALNVAVTYALTDEDELRIDYEATTDAATILNLTNHAYWNLAGAGAGKILGHELVLHARRFVAVDAVGIPTGVLAPAVGAMDFSSAKSIARDFAATVGTPGGYDHCFVLDPAHMGTMTLAAEVFEPMSGRAMTVSTTEPGIQFYTGNYLDGSVVGKGGVACRQHYGFCLETQNFPDAPNQPSFPSAVLRPGQTYRTSTVHRFSVR